MIINLIQAALGNAAEVRLYGSRVDNNAVGGDVDLLIETPAQLPVATEIALEATLQQALGQPVDIITAIKGRKNKPIVEIARLTGVRL